VAGVATVDSITNPDRMFEDAGIKVILGKVVQADPANKTLRLADGATIGFDKLVLAMGARQMVSPLEGSTLAGVFTLRSAEDAVGIRNYFEAANPRKLVLIGAGYSNLETASLLLTAKPEYYQATIIELMQYPLSLMLDREQASGVQEYLEEKGLHMKMGEKAARILGKNGRVSGVELTSGEQIPADFVMIAVGATPNLELAQQLAAEKQWEPALAILREIIEKGEDDEAILAALTTADYRLSREEYENAQTFLDTLQKRFPRNQKITRKLIQAHSLNESFGEAIKAIDGLLKTEDPQDPVLTIRKARLLEKWNKHSASQRTYAFLLTPPVDQILREKIQREQWPEVFSGAASLKVLGEEPPSRTLYRFYEEWVKNLETANLDSGLQSRIRDFVESLQARALIQKKVFLEMEGKDRLHRGQYLPARNILETLKLIDPENQEVDSDLERSYRLQP